MSTHPTTPQPVPHSALRRLVARHPVAAFLVMVYAVNIAIALPAVRTYLPSLPFYLVQSMLGHIFGPVVPLRAPRGAHRRGVRERDLWVGRAARTGDPVAAAGHGSGATAPALYRVLQWS